METELQKQLRIKSGALKRIQKEHISYRKEEQQLKNQYKAKEASGLSELDLKKQVSLNPMSKVWGRRLLLNSMCVCG